MKPLVYVASPCRADTPFRRDIHRQYAVSATRCALEAGVVPVAPHILYTQFLDDDVPADREAGLAAGRDLLAHCDEVWFFVDFGMSNGMRAELELAKQLGKRVVMRGLPKHGGE